MPFNTFTVGAAVTPSIIETYFSHYLNRAPLRQKPTAHISYHEGLRLVRQFLDYSSRHTVEDIQGFTGQWVPAPHWVRISDAEIAPKFLEIAVRVLQEHLGPRGLEKIGGKTWWQWRRPDKPLHAEWIEMKKDYNERKKTGGDCERAIFYVHGGAYYFGSVDEHRYQLQRHARKLRARVLAPRYRLAPQFPFPCGLYDCLAAYFYLLEYFRPDQIVFAGDSAGGGMVLAVLCVLRDQKQPLPAGTILLSPWVDLTHSFPSVAGDGSQDYIPPTGFIHRPSMAWPPPPSDGSQQPIESYDLPPDAVELPATAGLDMRAHPRATDLDSDAEDDEGANGDEPEIPIKPLNINKTATKSEEPSAEPKPGTNQNLGVTLDGKYVEINEQIQMYATNQLLSHPLVSPVMQPSLGGLPPMLIQTGGGELLRDEQIYLAHKAANPKAYPASDAIYREYDPSRSTLFEYPPTNVQLQVWEDLCHVPHTLSFTRPAKYMYRSVAQFGAWALAHAQKTEIEIRNDDAVSFISSGSEGEEEEEEEKQEDGDKDEKSTAAEVAGEKKSAGKSGTPSRQKETSVGKAGDPLPPFEDHMIRQRVTRHGVIYPLAPASEIPCLATEASSIGKIKPGPVGKWMTAKQSHAQKFSSEAKKVDKRRELESANGYDQISGERPPPTAIVGRLRKGVPPEEKKRGKSWGLAMWSGWGSSHDEATLQREEKGVGPDRDRSSSRGKLRSGMASINGSKQSLPPIQEDQSPARRHGSNASYPSRRVPLSRGRDVSTGPYEQVKDEGQADDSSSVRTEVQPVRESLKASLDRSPQASEKQRADDVQSVTSTAPLSIPAEPEAPVPTMSIVAPESEKIPHTENTFIKPSSARPHNGVVAYPFKLRTSDRSPSVVTLNSTTKGVSGASHSELPGDVPTPGELPQNPPPMKIPEPPISPKEMPTTIEQRLPDGAAVPSTVAATAALASFEEEKQDEDSSSDFQDASSEQPVEEVKEDAKDEQPTDKLNSERAEEKISDEKAGNASPEDEPANEQPADEVVSPLRVPHDDIKEGAISPVESLPIPVEGKSPLSTKTVFDPRTSMFGSIGADGMPTAHHDFPHRSLGNADSADAVPAVPAIPSEIKQMQAVNAVGAESSAKEAAPKASHATKAPQVVAERTRPSSSDAPEVEDKVLAGSIDKGTLPFKLRNKVENSFPPRSSSHDLDKQAATDSTKPLPFKLRHSVAHVRSPSGAANAPIPVEDMNSASSSPVARLAPKQLGPNVSNDLSRSHDKVLIDSDTAPEKSRGNGIQNNNRWDDSDDKPPPPPPKDEKHLAAASSAKTRSAGPSSPAVIAARVATQKVQAPGTIAPSSPSSVTEVSVTNSDAASSPSKLTPTAPRLGALSFETAAEERKGEGSPGLGGFGI